MWRLLPTVSIIALVLLAAQAISASDPPADTAGRPATWPSSVLITNDDGIEDESRLLALARAFRATGAAVTVAVPRQNRSGTTHLMTLANRSAEISVERLRDHEAENGGPTAAFYVVDGYPADCVLFALAGPLRESPPDLVVSGINGGPNLAEAWLGSGTIGAARIAAYAGFPALAISGIDDDIPGAEEDVSAWVVRLAASGPVRSLPTGAYLTVALPPGPLARLPGVRIAARNHLQARPILARRETGADSGAGETWEIADAVPGTMEPDLDVALYDEGYVVITPMRADEGDAALLVELRRRASELPELRAPAREP